ncbi:MAG TPA: hypothetical protein VI818_02270 [Candidatus Thermoplasmatota archaeon]|nr:hypothetical protein [Candidatus Thermoplasmatota archaeon]
MAWVPWDRVPYIIVGVLLLTIAGWIAYVRFRDPLYRTFATFLVLKGVRALAFVRASTSLDLYGRFLAYTEIAVPFVLLWLLYLVRLRYGPRSASQGPSPSSRAVFITLVAGAVLAEAAYVWDHAYYYGSATGLGPLTLLDDGQPFLLALMALLLVRDHVASRDGAAKTSLYVLALGLVLDPAYITTFLVVDDIGSLLGDPSGEYESLQNPVVAVLTMLDFAALILVGITLATLYLHARRSNVPNDWAAANRFTAVASTAIGTGLAIGVFFVITYLRAAAVPGPAPPGDPFLLALGLLRVFGTIWTAALPAALFVGYAFSKHRLFDLPARTRWTIEKGTLAGMFVTLAFIGTEGAQSFLESFAARQGWNNIAAVVGIVGAGVIVLAVTPLQRFAHRVAVRAMPDAKPLRDMSDDERVNLYREQVELAWLDGNLERKERLLLDSLRGRLGLAPDVASRIEGEVVERSLAPRKIRTKAR